MIKQFHFKYSILKKTVFSISIEYYLWLDFQQLYWTIANLLEFNKY